MGHVMFMRKGDVHTEPITLPIGTVWRFTSNGTFTAPADGRYQVEIHGGGGGAASSIWGGAQSAIAGGGGSGELYEIFMAQNDQAAVKIGAGGVANVAEISERPVNAAAGGTTTFGSLSCTGGSGGSATTSGINGEYSYSGGSRSGSLATSGGTNAGYGSAKLSTTGGYGNKNNTAQSYGNGGAVSSNIPQAGKAGAVIVTYLGKG